MRKTLLAIGVAISLLTVGCGGGGDDPCAVYFKIDSATCFGPGTQVKFFIAGNLVGTEFMKPGSTSSRYESGTSTTVLSAEAVDRSIIWTPETFNTPQNGSFTLLLTCN